MAPPSLTNKGQLPAGYTLLQGQARAIGTTTLNFLACYRLNVGFLLNPIWSSLHFSSPVSLSSIKEQLPLGTSILDHPFPLPLATSHTIGLILIPNLAKAGDVVLISLLSAALGTGGLHSCLSKPSFSRFCPRSMRPVFRPISFPSPDATVASDIQLCPLSALFLLSCVQSLSLATTHLQMT